MILVGIFSSRKYSILGAIRSSAQVISYEVCFLIFLFGLLTLERRIVISGRFTLEKCFIILPWFVGVLSETNRTPFDFSEGESELVRGFNTEYSRLGFVLLFLSEYGSLLLFRFLTRVLFGSGNFLFFLVILFSLVIIRSVFPRFRYDKLIRLF